MDSSKSLRAERRFIEHTRLRLRRERWLRLHVLLIALGSLAGLMAGGALLGGLGVESLALRYGLLLPLSYCLYLGLLRLWAGWLLSREEGSADALDLADLASELPLPRRSGGRSETVLEAGGGGDFGGAGASGDFEGGAVLGELAEGALKGGGEALGALDEGAVVLLPLAAVLAVGALLASLLGASIFMLFGVELLLAVAIEVALAGLAGGFAWRRQREGWLARALGHTWRSALGLLLLGVLLGAALDHWLPTARSLPHALELLRQR